MSLLSRFRILTKIIAVVAVLAAVSGAIAALAITSLRQIGERASVMAEASSDAILLMRLNAMILSINRGELQLASDSRPESRKAAHTGIDGSIKNFNTWLGQLKAKPLEPALMAQIDEMAKGWATYSGGLADIYKAADAVQSVDMSKAQEQLANVVEAREKAADAYRLTIRNIADIFDKRVDTTTKAAVDQAATAYEEMMLFAGLGIVIGLGLGLLTGHFGIVKPTKALVGLLQRMARGEDIEISGTERKDEVGDTARAVNGIKTMLADKAEREAAEKAAQEKQASADREAARTRMAEELQMAVGSIVRAAAAGDFSQRVDIAGKSGMIHAIGTEINSLCDNVGKVLDDLVGMLGALADGNLTQRITSEYQGRFAAIKNNANTTAERIGSTIAEIKHAATEVTNASSEISSSTTDLSQRTEEQAASLEETSASMEEMAATVKKNAENAQQASQFATETRGVADRGGKVVAEAVEAMTRIEESSRKIADIITVIDEIARQTNLLALNAAVEAARAGEAGRGFAVVASEVRTLAQRSAQAAKDIKDLIASSSSQVQQGVDLVNRTGASLNEIVESVKRVAQIVTEIASASAEQSIGIEQVNKALSQMDEVTQQNSALVEENAATAKTLEHQASAMDERVGFFRVDGMGAEALDSARASHAGAKPAAAKPAAVKLAATSEPRAAAKRAVEKAPARRAPAALPPRRGPAARARTATVAKEDQDWTEF
jgi:methyl-accepting chemotaxis protein